MKKLAKTLFIFSLELFLGCGSTLRIRSEPTEVSVFASLPEQKERKLLGKTPLFLKWSELSEKYNISASAGDFIQLDFEKPEFKSQKILVPSSRFTSVSVDVVTRLEAGTSEGKIASQMLQHLFNAQQMANQKEFERAQLELDKALVFDSTFVRALSLRGMIYFLQGNIAESLKVYEHVSELDPAYDDAIKMITHLRKVKSDPEVSK